MENSIKQAEFYDKNPPLAPWPDLLNKYALKRLYKPREVFWKQSLDLLNIKKDNSILEVGCGQGLFLSRIVNTYKAKGIGIDVSSRSINYANKKYKNKNLNYLKGSALKIPFKDKSFDMVLSFDVLEHIENQEKAVLEMIRVLKPKGKILIYTLNKNDKFTLDWIWEKLGIDIYKRAAHKRNLFINPFLLKKSFEKRGFKVSNPLLFDAFFTLFLDEIIMIKILLFKKMGLFRSKTTGKLFLYLFSFFSKLFYPLLNFLDSFWYKKGKSLSFLIIAEK